MDSLALLTDARAAGLTISAEGDRLIIRGPKSAERYAVDLLARKAEIVTLLAAETLPPLPAEVPTPAPPAVLIALPEPNLCPRCHTQGVTSFGRVGQNGSHPGLHRAFQCDVDEDPVWLMYRSGAVDS